MPITPYVAPSARPADLPVNTFTSPGGGVAGQTLFSLFDYYTPAMWTRLMVRHGQRQPFSLVLDAFGFTKGTSTPTTGHFELPWSKNMVKVGAIDTPAAAPGDPLIFELDATNMYAPGINVGGVAANASFVRKHDELYLPTDVVVHVTNVDTTVNPHLVTVVPKDGTINLTSGSHIVVDDEYFISGNAHAEASGLPDGRAQRLITTTNTFQIIKEKVETSGSELTNKAYFDTIENPNGGNITMLITGPMTSKAFMDHKSKVLLFGDQNTNADLLDTTTRLGYDTPITGTEGFVPYAVDNSFTDTYTPGAYALSDFNALAKQFEGEWLNVRKFTMWEGIEHYQELQGAVFNALNVSSDMYLANQMGMSTQIPGDDMQFNSASDYMAQIDFQSFSASGYTWLFKTLHEFNEYLGAGNPAYEFTQWAIITPFGFNVDAKSGEQAGTVGYEYKQLGKYSRRSIVSPFAGAGASPYYELQAHSNEYDTAGLAFVCEIAGRWCLPNTVIIQRPV